MNIIHKSFLLLLLYSLTAQQDVIGAAYLAPAGCSASDLKIRFDSSIPAEEKIKLIVNALDILPHPQVSASVIEERLKFISQMPPNPEENNSLWLAAEDTALFIGDALFGLDTRATNIDEKALLCAEHNKNNIACQYFKSLYEYLNKSASPHAIPDEAYEFIDKKLKTETLDIERLDVFLTFFRFQHLSCLNMFSSPDALTWKSREKRKRVISFLLRRLYEGGSITYSMHMNDLLEEVAEEYGFILGEPHLLGKVSHDMAYIRILKGRKKSFDNVLFAQKIREMPKKYDSAKQYKDFFLKFADDLEKIAEWLLNNKLQHLKEQNISPEELIIARGCKTGLPWFKWILWHKGIHDFHIEEAIQSLKGKLNFPLGNIFAYVMVHGGSENEEKSINNLIKTYNLLQTKVELDDLKNPSSWQIYDDLKLALYIMGHGGPLEIDHQSWNILRKHAEALNDSTPREDELTEMLFNKADRATDIIIQPLCRLKDKLNEVEVMLFYSNYIDIKPQFTKIKCMDLELFETPNIFEWIKQKKDDYLYWLKETERVLTDIRDLVEENPSLGNGEHIQHILRFTKHYRQVVRIMQAFLLEKMPAYLKDDIVDIHNLHQWLERQAWESKDKEYEVRVTPSDVIIPMSNINGSMLALSIERLISNGFHAIEDNEERLSLLQRIVTIVTDIRSDAKRKKYAQIRIINPGSINEKKLEIDKVTGLPKLFIVSREKEDRGGGLKFAVQAIQKMGGTVSVVNKKQYDQDIVEFVVEFPLEHSPAEEITESTVYQAARMIAESK